MGLLSAVLPSSELLAFFDNLASPIIGTMLARTQQSSVLGNIRDVLLPRLISGELRVADAEKRIVAA
jgi:type I restriction enzyme S subunit